MYAALLTLRLNTYAHQVMHTFWNVCHALHKAAFYLHSSYLQPAAIDTESTTVLISITMVMWVTAAGKNKNPQINLS